MSDKFYEGGFIRPRLVPNNGSQTAITTGKEGPEARREREYDNDISGSHENQEYFKPSMEIPGTDTWTDYNE